MINVNNQKTPTLDIVAHPKSTPGKVAAILHNAPFQDVIRARAYELYVSRGREPGQDEQDWFRAEREILSAEQEILI